MFLNKYIYGINYYSCLHSMKINKCSNFHTAANVSFKSINENIKNAYDIVNPKTSDIDNFYGDHHREDLENMLCKEWSKEVPQSLFLTMTNLKRYCLRNHICISDKRFDNLIDSLADNITNATEHELKTIFASLSLFKTNEKKCARLRNYIEVWAALDDECIKRTTMTINDKLSYISLFHELGAVKYSDFCYKYLSKLMRDTMYLQKYHVVQIMFYVGLLKNFNKEKNIHNVEAYLVDHFTEFHIDELAIIANALYGIKIPIRCSNLINNIIEKIIEKSNEIQESSLLHLLKLVKISLKPNSYDKIYQLSDCLDHQLFRLPIQCHIYLALLQASANRIHVSCLSNIAENAMTCMSSISLKNLERLIHAYGILNFVPTTKQCFFTKIVQELTTRNEEICKHGKIFANCIARLSLLNIYPEDLMKRVLNKKFLENVYGNRCFSYSKHILTIHNSAKIFYKESIVGNLLDREIEILSKRNTSYVPDENKNNHRLINKLFIDIKKTLQEYRGGGKYVLSGHILTHYRYGDIIICNNHEGIPQAVDKAFAGQPFGVLSYPPDDNNWIVLILDENKNREQTSEIQKLGKPSGINITKKRELKQIGYHAAIINLYMYNECRNHSEKNQYLNKIINDAINNKNK